MAELIPSSGFNDFTLETLQTPSGIAQLNSILGQIYNNIAGNTDNVRVFYGNGTPEAAVAAGVGSLYMRADGAADTAVYRKESGSGDTGWVAIKAPASLPLSLANGGTGVALSDPNADRILFWDDSAGQIDFLVPNTNIAISGTNLNATNLSNVIFNNGCQTVAAQSQHHIAATSLTPTHGTPGYEFWSVSNNDTYETVFHFRWVKIASVSTLTIISYIWQASTTTANVRLSVGAATNNVSGTGSQTTPEKVSFTVDVSALVNGTEYDCLIDAKSVGGSNTVYVGETVVLGS